MELKLKVDFIDRHKLSKNMQFDADADIYMTKM